MNEEDEKTKAEEDEEIANFPVLPVFTPQSQEILFPFPRDEQEVGQ